jgi:hypothetical protein
MKHAFDAATAAIASGLSRRHVLKTVTSTVLAAVAVHGTEAAEPHASHEESVDSSAPPKFRALELKLFRANENGVTKLFLRDRQPARITAPGQSTVALVPHFMNELAGVELSIYEHKSMTLAKRLPLSLKAKAVPAGVTFLPGVTFVASRFVPVATEPLANDCCVSCCNGYHICASGVCCDTSNSNCGTCCDYGSCQPNCNCCS